MRSGLVFPQPEIDIDEEPVGSLIICVARIRVVSERLEPSVPFGQLFGCVPPAFHARSNIAS